MTKYLYDGVGRLAEARHPGYDGASHRTQYHHDSVGNVSSIPVVQLAGPGVDRRY